MAIEEIGLYKLDLEVYQENEIEVLQANEGDVNGRGLLVTLMNNGVAFDSTGIDLKLGFKNKLGEDRMYNFTEVDKLRGKYKIAYPLELVQDNGGKILKIDVKAVETSTSHTLSFNPMVIKVRDTTVTEEGTFTPDDKETITQLIAEIRAIGDNLNTIESGYAPRLNQVEVTTQQVNTRMGTVESQYAGFSGEITRIDGVTGNLQTQVNSKLSVGQARQSTSIVPINSSEMDTATRALFTGGSVAVVGESAVGTENLKVGSVDITSLSAEMKKKIGLEDTTLTWQIGSPEAGVVKPSRTNSVTSVQLLDISEKGVEVYLKPNAGLQYWLAYYDMSGVYTSETPNYLTNPIVEARPNTKIRITFVFVDLHVLANIFEVTNKIAVVRNIGLSSTPSLVNSRTIPTHWTTHLNTKISAITTLQNQGGADCTSLVFITDTHISGNNQNSGVLVEKIVKECDVPFVVHGGDFVTGHGTASKQSILNDIKLDREMFGDVWDRVLRTEGNHDAAYDGDASVPIYYTKNLTEEECYNYMFRHNSLQPQKVVGGNKSYFYQDDIVNKIRIIMLNSSDLPAGVDGTGKSLTKYNKMQKACMREAQVNWFANVALQVPDDTWSVLVCSHIEPYSTDMIVQNGNMAAEILQAFKNKTGYSGSSKATVEAEFKFTTSVHFGGKGGNVIGWLSGHMHADSLNRNRPVGINYNIVETLNDSKNVWAGQPNKTTGTATEQAFDVLTINKKTRKVNLTRIGAGTDRLFTY